MSTKFEFYIVSKSFQYQNGISKEEIENGIKSLSVDYNYMNRYKETDKMFVHKDIYNVIIFPEFSVIDLLYSPKGRQHFDRDVIFSLSNIIDKSESTTISTSEVVEVLLNQHNEKNVYALFCLHYIEEI